MELTAYYTGVALGFLMGWLFALILNDRNKHDDVEK